MVCFTARRGFLLSVAFFFRFQFEWAWQNPKLSRRLKHITAKGRTEKVYDYCIRIFSEMLNLGPWNRLPLNVRWLNAAYRRDFSVSHKQL